MIDLTPILQAIIALLAALVTYRLIPWIKARTTEAQQKQLESAYKIAVFAAEQLYGSGFGAEKLDYATKYLADRGYSVDRALIESMVYDYLNPGSDHPPDTENE